MSAHTRTRPTAPAKGSVEVTLPWWAIALPAIAFGALLLLILNPADAHAAGTDPSVVEFFDRVRESAFHVLP
ncbi:hypothetical protein DSC45_11775 [Streptomyces sp. YIM 130001]|uniref:hypothetical protein n=1 Tax=Streptomyces sp. YIM 130001 TaxID=2259644 RepID=UPI000E64D662|nr:hypothetical protein [Streptomyces sp. YIM 130001]RII18589.1 hypothetical protein DSC45_11775 [Streptomyces sp. YIM 130001]